MRTQSPDVQRIIDRRLQVKVVRHNPDLYVCRVAGEVDLLTVPTLVNVLDDLREREAPAVVVDLTGVTYCAAAGVRALLDATETARAAGQRLAVVIASLTVARVLKATDTIDGIENYSNLSEAMLAMVT
ncbi:STAS domain-containing protein [Actinophytocola oryzae]|uniref:Anti-sigma factor antagonist n=1 Tax=Actinophytocola oryzae TaxID=502181 RepID=A0A4R7UQ03_9PSEU|nr:STAS domain-containing protein [Actinophytocola oryzae]TDV36025.1 anti-anti-sigma factor [Actinophytocola oryzae]